MTRHQKKKLDEETHVEEVFFFIGFMPLISDSSEPPNDDLTFCNAEIHEIDENYHTLLISEGVSYWLGSHCL